MAGMPDDPAQSVVDHQVWRATARDWATYRDVRLASLADSPDAFGSTLARETELTEADWKARVARSATFLGARGGRALATATGIRSTDPDDGGVEIVGVWAHPDARGTGLPAATVRAVVSWAGERPVRLWVAVTNVAAERFYAKLGFEPTGRRGPLPRDHSITELEMALA